MKYIIMQTGKNRYLVGRRVVGRRESFVQLAQCTSDAGAKTILDALVYADDAKARAERAATDLARAPRAA